MRVGHGLNGHTFLPSLLNFQTCDLLLKRSDYRLSSKAACHRLPCSQRSDSRVNDRTVLALYEKGQPVSFRLLPPAADGVYSCEEPELKDLTPTKETNPESDHT